MPVIDTNGIAHVTETDSASFLDTINTLQGHTSSAVAGITRRGIYTVPNQAARATLAASVSPAPSASNPLYVHRSNAASGAELEYTTDGAAWRTVSYQEPDSGWVESFLSSASGWAVTGGGVSRIRSVGPWTFIRIEVKRTGGTISVNSKGDVTNQTVCTLNPQWRPDWAQTLQSAESGRVASFMVNASGEVRLHAVGGTADIATGDSFSLRGHYRNVVGPYEPGGGDW